MEQVDLAGMHKYGFCEGKRLLSYFETKRYTMWSCWDGGSFMVPKTR